MSSADYGKPPNSSDTLDIEKTAMLGDSDIHARVSARSRLPGDQFGRYRIQKVLGSGAMGEVYLAHDTQLDRKVALKIPKFDSHTDSKAIARFLREARSAANLSHPNICPVFDVGEHKGTHFMTMAYINGRTLSEYINPDNPQPDRNVANVVRKIAAALHEAHINGLVHRDVKPGNIMIDQRSEPIVMDFGLARHIDDDEDARLTRDGAILGSPAYMSPEQVEGRKDRLGPASDIYSLGVILYEMLTGQLPFRGTVTAIIGQILSKSPEDPRKLRPEIHPRIAEICLRAMARRIEDRYSSMQALATALTEFLKAKPEDEKESAASDSAAASKSGIRKTPPAESQIEAKCSCGQRLVAKAELAGKRVRCPKCAQQVQMPIPGQIDVACQQCGQKFRALEELAGRVVKCPVCSKPLVVPTPTGEIPGGPRIEVTCQCGQQFVATAALAGKRVACTACGRRLTIPHS